MKKIFSGIIILLFFVFFINVNTKVYGHEVISEEDKFYIFIESDENLNINVGFELYKSIPIFDEENNIVQFKHQYYDTYVMNKDELQLDRISDYMLVKIDLSTLPSGYGVREKTIFVNDTVNITTINLLEINDCSISDANNSTQVDFYTSAGEKIFCHYELEENELDDTYSIRAGNLSFVREKQNLIANFTVAQDEYLNQIDDTEEIVINTRGLIQAELTYTPSYTNIQEVNNTNSRFTIYYDGNTMTNTNAQKVANGIELIDQFFCDSSNGLNFSRPRTNSSDEYHIYLETNATVGGSLGETWWGTASSSLGFNSGNYSYILLNYDLVNCVNSFNSAQDDAYLNTLAHEYFHAIQWNAGSRLNDSHNSGTQWVAEGLATTAGLLYINSINTDHTPDPYVDSLFNTRINLFISTTNLSLDYYTSYNIREYNTFIFFTYLIKEYGFDLIKEIIDSYDSSLNTLDIINTALTSEGTNLNDVFKDFSVNNSYLNLNYKDILIDYYVDDWERNTANTVDYYYSDDSFPSSGTFNLPYLSSDYILLKSIDCDNYDSFVTIDLSSIEGIDLTTVRKTDDDTLYYHSYDISDGLITIPQYNFGYHICDELIFALTNSNLSGASVTIDYDVTIIHQEKEIEEGNNIDVSDLHYPSFENYYKFTPETTDMYEFSLNVTKSGTINYPSNCIEILDEEKNIIYKYSLSDYNVEAKCSEGSNKVIVKLDANTQYYVKIKYNYSFTNLTLDINKVNNNIELTDNDNLNLIDQSYEKGDYLYSITPKMNGKYYIEFLSNDETNNTYNYAVLMKNNGEIILMNSGVINEDNSMIRTELNLVAGKTYYFGYFNSNNSVKTYNVKIERIISQSLTLKADLNMNVTVGTEVSLNGGLCEGTTITQGFTRCVYLTSTSPSNSRLDYYWYSMDETKAIVSNYGTVTAIEHESISSVQIMAVYKYDYSIVGIIEFEVRPDTSDVQKNVILCTDMRATNPITGTEVSLNGGDPGENTIQCGFTRLICFESNNPSDSIQDYIWTSSDSSIATVSSFGTITAMNKTGEVVITGVYKYNDNYVASITIQVYSGV